MRQRTSVSAAAVFLIGGALALPVAPAVAQTPAAPPAARTPAAPPAAQTPAAPPAAQTPADQVPKIEADSESRTAQPARKAARRHARTHRRAGRTVRVRTSYYYALGYNRGRALGFRRAYLGAYQGGPTYSAAYYGYSTYDGHPYDAAYNGTGLIRDLPYRYRVRVLAGAPR